MQAQAFCTLTKAYSCRESLVMQHRRAQPYARESQYGLDRNKYSDPRERYGRIAILWNSQDHLQLPPVPKSSGLLAPLEQTSDAHKAGASMFNNLHYLFEMETMKRFQAPVLVAILHKMRCTNGTKLSDQEWQALLATELDVSQLELAPEAFLNETAGWFESSYLWSVVSMACYSRAMASARQHGAARPARLPARRSGGARGSGAAALDCTASVGAAD